MGVGVGCRRLLLLVLSECLLNGCCLPQAETDVWPACGRRHMTSACMCARVPPAGRASAVVEQRLWDVLAPWIPQAGKLQLRWKSRGAHILCYPSVDALLIAGLYRKEHALANPGLLLFSGIRMSHQTLEACLTCSISCGRVRSWIASSTTIR